MVDYFSRSADLVVRYQGGDNAGHTVSNEFGTFKLHTVPCGVFKKGCVSLLGTGMVVNPDVLIEELDELKKKGVDISGVRISAKATVLLPYHIDLDSLFERGRGGVGSTKRGIAFAYADRARRSALRFEDLKDLKYCRERLDAVLDGINAELDARGGKQYLKSDLLEDIMYWQKTLGQRVVEPVGFVNDFINKGKNVIFEGQLGVMKDIDLGIYPFVTSSNPLAAYAAVSGGFPVSKITHITGVAKAFSSAVGKGPFPTEDADAAALRGTGEHIDDEFGARTGRPRRLGWLDLPVLRYAATVNGFTEIVLCKIDKFDTFGEIKVCTGYKLDGKEIDSMPSPRELARVEPVYKTVKGWKKDTSKIKKIADLPKEAKAYLKLVEDYTGVPVKYVGVGPGRDNVAD
jgi:adenylosuccinate synthase